MNFEKSLKTIVNWKNFNLEFTKSIQQNTSTIDAISNSTDLDNWSDTWSKTIMNTLKNNSKQVENNNHAIKTPNKIIEMIEIKKKLQREFSKSHDPFTKNMINNLSNKIKRYSKKVENDKWNDLCAFLAEKKPGEPTFWKIIKEVECGNKIVDTTILPNIKSNKEKANIFATFYKSTFSNNKHDNNFEKLFNINNISNFNNPITKAEVISSIKTSKSTNSTGIDLISNKVMKNLPNEAFDILAKLFNHSLRLSHVPDSWKIAKIKVLRKKDKELDKLESYRPISLLNTISRLLEKVINKRLMEWAESNHIIHINQSGFRKNHSTQDNIFKLIESAKNGIQLNKKCGVVLFDIEKQFDKSPHKGILMRLEQYGCPSMLGNWLCSFFQIENL
jgi:hypothetical protein